MKNFKTFYEAQTAINKIIQHPTKQKLPTSLEQKSLYGNIQAFAFQVL